MHAVSMMQPFAWLFTHGYLTTDDRTRGTSIRGLVAIHASKKFHQPYYDFIRARTGWPMPDPDEFEHGALVGVARLVACKPPAPADPPPAPDIRRAHFGAPGFHGLVFEAPEVRTPVPFRGNVGFFPVPDDVWSDQLSAGCFPSREAISSPCRPLCRP